MKEDLTKRTIISIDGGSVVKTIIIVILFILLFIIRDLVLVVLASVVIASAIEPATLWFGKYHIGRIPAVIITYGAIVSIFFGIFFFFVPSLLNETSSFLSSIPQYFNSSSSLISDTSIQQSQKVVSDLSSTLTKSQILLQDGFSSASTTNAIDKVANTSVVSSLGDIITNFGEIASNFSGSFVNTVTTVFGGLLSFILIVVLSFYLAVQEDGIASFLRLVTPARNEKYIIDLWKRAQVKIGLWMQGQILLAVLIGVLVYLGLTILGVKNALMLAFIAAVFEVIPLFGPILSAIPGIIFGYAAGGITMALLVMGLYIIVQQFENHLIYPLIVKKIVGVPAILVIISLVIGWELAGFIGILISVPIVTALMEYLRDIQEYKAKARDLI